MSPNRESNEEGSSVWIHAACKRDPGLARGLAARVALLAVWGLWVRGWGLGSWVLGFGVWGLGLRV